jgi:cell division septum initiation protein DivIVA
MERDETKLLQELRDPQLPRGVRGYQEDATRNLLDLVAVAFDRVAKERDRLRESAADPPPVGRAEEPSAETIGQTVATAAALGERLVAQAKQQAAVLRAEAEAEAAGLLATAREEAAQLRRELTAARTKLESERDEQRRELELRREAVESERNETIAAAHREAAERLAGRRAEIARLEAEASELRSFIETATTEFVSIARAALGRLGDIEAPRETQAEAAAGLLADTPPSTAGPAPTPPPGTDVTRTDYESPAPQAPSGL